MELAPCIVTYQLFILKFIEIFHCNTYYGQTQLLLQTHRKQLHYKIKYSCAVVCWIRAQSWVSLDSVPRHTWHFTSNCLLFGKQSSLMAGRDCLSEDVLYVCDDWWWTAGLLSCSKQFFLHFCYTILVDIHNTSTAEICRNHWQSLPYTVFDLILAGDTMQNLKWRVDFYYS